MAIDVVALEDAVLGAVRETVAEVNPTCHATVTLDSSLERDLGLDSLVRVDLLMRIEDALDVRFSGSLVVDAETPRDLVDAALRLQAGGQAPAIVHPLHPAPSEALPLEVRTVLEALEWHASVHPDRVHVQLVGDDPTAPAVPLTYATLRDRGRAIAAGLAAADIRPGDTIAIMLATSLLWRPAAPAPSRPHRGRPRRAGSRPAALD